MNLVSDNLYIHNTDLDNFMLVKGLKFIDDVMFMGQLIDTDLDEMQESLGSVAYFYMDAFDLVVDPKQI